MYYLLKVRYFRDSNPIYMAPSDDERECHVVLISYLVCSPIVRIFRNSNVEFPSKWK